MSDIRKNEKQFLFGWLGITVFCMIFAFIYELFSHGVYSRAMIFMFVYPLLLGFVPSMILKVLHKPMPGRLWQDGVLILTLGSLVTGIIEIFGSTTEYTLIYRITGICFLICDPVIYLIRQRKYA